MLQDAIWANADKLADDEAYADQTVKFIKASIKGWIYAADNPRGGRRHRGRRRLAAARPATSSG